MTDFIKIKNSLITLYADKPMQFYNDYSYEISKSYMFVQAFVEIIRESYKLKKPKIYKPREITGKITTSNIFSLLPEKIMGDDFSTYPIGSAIDDCCYEVGSTHFPKIRPVKIGRPLKSAPLKIKINFKKYNDLTDIRTTYIPETIKIRNEILLVKIKNILFIHLLNRCPQHIKFHLLALKANYFNKFSKYNFEANMDEKTSAQGESDTAISDSHGNTLNEAQRAASSGMPAKIVPRQAKVFNKLASAESSTDCSAMTDRFFPHGTYEWGKNSENGSVLNSLTLPLDFIVGHPNAPNCTLFSSYAYWDGDVEVKLMVNSNKFQVGQLQMAWYYGQDYEKNFDRRNNIYTASQQAHCLISAASSNEGKLYIPFRYYKPKMGTCDRTDDPGKLNMGRLTVRVLNELTCPSTTYNKCTYTISFRFVNSNFSGMKARDLGHLTMEANMYSFFKSVSVRAAMAVLEELGADPQRDNPPVTAPPCSVVPWSSHSWSVGDNMVEPINALRINAAGQTPHPAEVCAQYDEMSIKLVTSTFGLVFINTWHASMRTGHLLFSLSGSPMISLNNYFNEVYDGTNCYALPPIAVISSLFAYWRGTIELRLDLIASAFHTGRLLLAYIPRVLSVPTLEQAKSSPHAVFDLQGESRQFVFKIPYIADRPWWHSEGFGSNIISPSHVYCFVLNELVPMDNVANYVSINVYMRGGDDFEVSIPVVPRLGLSTYNAYVEASSSSLAVTKPGYTPMYAGNWRYLVGGKKDILRYGTVVDHVVQFDNLHIGVVYEPDVVRNGGIIRARGDVQKWYLVGLPIDVAGGMAMYATAIADYTTAYNYAKSLNNDILPIYPGSDSGYFDRTDGTAVDGPIYFKPVATSMLDGVIKFVANMDERRDALASNDSSILPSLLSTNSGLSTFGENFSDLKVLCRRYQLYCSLNEKIVVKEQHLHRVRIPLLPQGLPRTDADIDASSFLNFNREGFIPIIASAYRFYRGGLRIRVVWRSDWDCCVRIEHRPDERLTSYDLSLESPIKRVHKHVYNDGYAFIIQSTQVNRIIELEIPFYQCGVLGLLQNPMLEDNLESYHFSLGNMYVGFSCDSSSSAARPVIFDVYYSLADDCRFSVFQGFPLMMRAVDSDQPVNFEAQMGILSDIRTSVSEVKALSTRATKMMDKVETLIPIASTSKFPLQDDIEKKTGGIFDYITKTVPEKLRTMMLNGFSQLVHCFINPTLKTIAWAFASFLTITGVLCHDVFHSFSKYMGQLVEWLFNRGQTSETKQGSEIKLEANMDEGLPEDIRAGLIGTIVTSIAATMGVVGRMPKNVPDFTRGCWNNLGRFAMTANHMCTFFKNNLDWIMRAYKWVVARAFPDKALAMEVQSADLDIQNFAAEALTLLDVTNARKLETNPRWNTRLYACAAEASVLMIKLCASTGAPKMVALLSLIRDVLKKRDDLVKYQLSPPIRSEPYVAWIVGETNIGKSHMCQNIGKELLKAIKYKSFEEIIYTRTPGNPYWNQLRNQPICLYDDFIAIGGEQGLQQAGELFCLKSRAIFNPPQAEIKDKHIRYNPLMVFLAANQAFPKVPNVENDKAFFRRRDILIKVLKNKEFYKKHNVSLTNGTPKSFKLEDIKNYEHLLFKIADDVQDVNTKWSDCYLYKDLVKLLKGKYVTFYEREYRLYKAAIDEALEFYPDDEEDSSMKGELDRINRKIDRTNQYRVENLVEIEELILSIAPTVKTKSDKLYTTVVNLLAVVKLSCEEKYDKYISDYPVFNDKPPTIIEVLDTAVEAIAEPLVPDMESSGSECGSESESEYDEDNSPFDTRLYLPTTSTGPERPTNVAFSHKIPLKKICVHHGFKPDLDFVRENTTVTNGIVQPGHFYSAANTKAKIPETLCEGEALDYCKWNEPGDLFNDMQLWLNEPYAIDRVMAYKVQDLAVLPMHFIKHSVMSVPVVEDERRGSVAQEVKTWKQWATSTIKSIGNGIFDALSWALVVVASTALIFGMARIIFPGDPKKDTDKRRLQTGFYYDKMRHSTMGMGSGLYDSGYIRNRADNEKYIRKVEIAEKEGNMHSSGDYKTYGKSKNSSKPREVAVKMIGNLAPEYENNILKLIHRNTVFIEAVNGSTTLVGRLLGITDHYAIAVDHYNDKFAKLPKTAAVYIKGFNFRVQVQYDSLIYKRFQNSSLGYYKLPVQIPPFRNLLKHFASQRDHERVGPLSQLVEITESGVIHSSSLYTTRVSAVHVPASNGFNAFDISDGYRYAKGGRGVCGSVLLSDHLSNPIMGIHVAGDVGGNCGISEAVTSEQFDHLLSDAFIKDVVEANMLDYQEGYTAPRSHVQMLGIVDREFAHRETGKSGVIPTECCGQIFDVHCAPPVLSSKDNRIAHKPFSPMQEGVDKHGLVTKNFPPDILAAAKKDLKNLILARVKSQRRQVGMLPISTAVVGDECYDGYDKLDFNTSEGFPYVTCRPKNVKSKKWLLDVVQDDTGRYEYKGMHSMLQEIMELKHNQRLAHKLPFTVFTDCLKDRKLPVEKVLLPGKVRIFSISPLDYTIQCRQYFMDYTVAYQNARLDVEHAVGIDVNSFEWSDLAMRLLAKNSDVITADYSGFGPSLNAQCAEACVEIINDWYDFNGDDSQQNKHMRKMLGYEAIHSNHLCFSVIYKTLCGMPSGGPLTVIFNTMVNQLYVRAAWLLIFRNTGVNLQDYNLGLQMFAYGDDLIIATEKKYLKRFNCITLAETLGGYDIIVKNASKDDEIISHLGLNEPGTTFLKHRFVGHPSRQSCFLAALDIKSVQDTLNWTFKEWRHKLREISLEASTACVLSAFGNGKQCYDNYTERVQTYWQLQGEKLALPTWEDIDERNYGSLVSL